jgi:hypothetical protein
MSARCYAGRLVRYRDLGNAEQVDEDTRSVDPHEVPNLLDSSSRFIYAPDFSVIAAQHVWNKIQLAVFCERFAQIVHKSHPALVLGNVELHPIAELRTFAWRVGQMQCVHEIRAEVLPSNPYFGHLWKSLDEYTKRRGRVRVKHEEKADEKSSGIATRLPHVLAKFATQDSAPPVGDGHDLDIGDAAVLMAADGYGTATVAGIDKVSGRRVIVRTSASVLSFQAEADDSPQDLADQTVEYAQRAERISGLEHGE